MDTIERRAFENYAGQLEVERVTVKSEQVASATSWQKFNLFLTHLNGGHVIEVSVPTVDPRYGTAHKTMYFNPNTFAFMGYGYRQ